jgi:hypothetical protein
MKLDPILAEVRRVREEYALQFNGDIKAMLADLRQRQEASGHKTVALEPKRIKPSPTGSN